MRLRAGPEGGVRGQSVGMKKPVKRRPVVWGFAGVACVDVRGHRSSVLRCLLPLQLSVGSHTDAFETGGANELTGYHRTVSRNAESGLAGLEWAVR